MAVTYTCDGCGGSRRVLTLHRRNEDVHFCSVSCLQEWAMDTALTEYINGDEPEPAVS